MLVIDNQDTIGFKITFILTNSHPIFHFPVARGHYALASWSFTFDLTTATLFSISHFPFA
jgi:hypothetical protein